MSRRFVKEFANYLLDSLYPKETKGKIRKVVYNYEVTGLISTRQAMYSLSDIARERENIAYDPETGESTILNSANEISRLLKCQRILTTQWYQIS